MSFLAPFFASGMATSKLGYNAAGILNRFLQMYQLQMECGGKNRKVANCHRNATPRRVVFSPKTFALLNLWPEGYLMFCQMTQQAINTLYKYSLV